MVIGRTDEESKPRDKDLAWPRKSNLNRDRNEVVTEESFRKNQISPKKTSGQIHLPIERRQIGICLAWKHFKVY